MKATKNVSSLRATRLANLTVAYRARRTAAKQAAHAAATAAAEKRAADAANKAAYLAEVAAIAAKYGVNTSATKAPRSNGACAKVHELAKLHNFDRQATLAACAAAGINAATAATQYAIAKRSAAPVAA